jgi:tripartite-type tricarboxylate transporter receptor subunit TctC
MEKFRNAHSSKGFRSVLAHASRLSPLASLLFLMQLFNPLTLQPAFAQTPFYQGKTINIIVGTKAGDAYDLYPRLMAEYLPKYIPGSPNVIIQNVPGAASMIAANQIYNVSKPDGLTIGAIYPALYLDQLANKPEVRFDWSKFHFIGTPVVSNHLMYMRSDAPY